MLQNPLFINLPVRTIGPNVCKRVFPEKFWKQGHGHEKSSVVAWTQTRTVMKPTSVEFPPTWRLPNWVQVRPKPGPSALQRLFLKPNWNKCNQYGKYQNMQNSFFVLSQSFLFIFPDNSVCSLDNFCLFIEIRLILSRYRTKIKIIGQLSVRYRTVFSFMQI